jgi:hypothetical protein
MKEDGVSQKLKDISKIYKIVGESEKYIGI